jgi:hypothetical protein
MTGLRPFQPKRDAPLTGGARFIRGFTRIGTVVAVLTVLIGVPGSIIAGVNNYNGSRTISTQAHAINHLQGDPK